MKIRSGLLACAVASVLCVSMLGRRAGAQDSSSIRTADTTTRRKTPFSVSVVDGKKPATVHWASPLGLLVGNVPGLRAVPVSNQPGTVPALRLRAASGFAGEPLVVVDGVVSRISTADLHSDDIDRIEVIPGAAAGAIYGSDAAHGVIHIITKRGQGANGGGPQFSFRSELGVNSAPKNLSLSGHHHFRLNPNAADFLRDALGIPIQEPDGIADNRYPFTYSLRDPLLDTRSMRSAYLSASDRIGTTSYYVSAQHDGDPGFFRLQSGLRRQSGRLNADHAIGDRLRISAGGLFSRSNSELLEDEAGWLESTRWIQPSAKLDSVTANCPPGMATCYAWTIDQFLLNPLYDLDATDRDDRRNRTTATFQAAYQLTSWLAARATYANDQLVERAWRDRAYPATGSFPSLTEVEDLDGWRHVVTTAAAVTANRSWLGGRVQQGATLSWDDERQLLSERYSRAQGQTGTPIISGSSGGTRWNERVSGVGLATQFDVGRIIVDGAVRREASRMFNKPDARAYHRIGAAYVARESDADFLRFRVAHGTSAQRVPHQVVPRLISKPDNLIPVYAYVGGVPMARETEMGLDARLPFGFDVGATYALQTADEFVITPMGFGSFTFLTLNNAARVKGKTIAVNLGVDVLDGPWGAWRVDLTGSQVRRRYTRLSTPEVFWGPGGVFKFADGDDVGTIYGIKWIRTQAQLEETIALGVLAGPVDSYVLNEEGYFVRLTEWQTINETPLVYRNCQLTGPCSPPPGVSGFERHRLGTTSPDFEVGFNNSVSWRSFSARAGIVAVLGGQVYNEARRSVLLSGRDPVEDQSSKPTPWNCAQTIPVDPCVYTTGKKPLRYYRVLANAGSEILVEDGTFARVRELALEWRLPRRWLDRLPGGSNGARVSLLGRNLWTFTRYSGYDPEIASPYFSGVLYRVDTGTSYPAYPTVSAALSLNF